MFRDDDQPFAKEGIEMPRDYSAPSYLWVKFLRAYGPIPGDLNLFDE